MKKLKDKGLDYVMATDAERLTAREFISVAHRHAERPGPTVPSIASERGLALDPIWPNKEEKVYSISVDSFLFVGSQV
jgi:hypothetical protein